MLLKCYVTHTFPTLYCLLLHLMGRQVQNNTVWITQVIYRNIMWGQIWFKWDRQKYRVMRASFKISQQLHSLIKEYTVTLNKLQMWTSYLFCRTEKIMWSSGNVTLCSLVPIWQITWCHIQEDCNLRIYCCENLQSLKA
jgi:hypothetical protein